MRKIRDLTGQRFGRLVALTFTSIDKTGRAIWSCECDCGMTKNIVGYCLTRGTTKSCGCWMKEQRAQRADFHGKSDTRAHSIWTGMMSRCNNQNATGYARYGGRGITVCERWKKFISFLEDMGDPPAGYTLDRVDNDKGYYKENCRWATPIEQNNNTRSNRYITAFGETKTIAEWARERGMKYITLHRRIHWSKWSAEKAITTTVK